MTYVSNNPVTQFKNPLPPTSEEMKEAIRIHKLRLSDMGYIVPMDPDEAEKSGCFEDNAISIEDALEARWTPEDLEETLKNAPDVYKTETVPLEVANEILNSVIGIIMGRIYEIEETDPAEDKRLSAIGDKINNLRKDLLRKDAAYSQKIIEEWGHLLKAKDNDKILWEKLNDIQSQ